MRLQPTRRVFQLLILGAWLPIIYEKTQRSRHSISPESFDSIDIRCTFLFGPCRDEKIWTSRSVVGQNRCVFLSTISVFSKKSMTSTSALDAWGHFTILDGLWSQKLFLIQRLKYSPILCSELLCLITKPSPAIRCILWGFSAPGKPNLLFPNRRRNLLLCAPAHRTHLLQRRPGQAPLNAHVIVICKYFKIKSEIFLNIKLQILLSKKFNIFKSLHRCYVFASVVVQGETSWDVQFSFNDKIYSKLGGKTRETALHFWIFSRFASFVLLARLPPSYI